MFLQLEKNTHMKNKANGKGFMYSPSNSKLHVNAISRRTYPSCRPCKLLDSRDGKMPRPAPNPPRPAPIRAGFLSNFRVPGRVRGKFKKPVRVRVGVGFTLPRPVTRPEIYLHIKLYFYFNPIIIILKILYFFPNFIIILLKKTFILTLIF